MEQSHPIIDAEALATELHSTVVLDCRFSLTDTDLGQQQCARGHIPGAFYAHLNQHLSSAEQTYGGRHPLPRPKQFAQQLALWGITRQSQVVVYDDQCFGFAARAWWLLRAAGINNVRLLNGGFQAWQDADLALDRRQPKFSHTQADTSLQLSREPQIHFEALQDALVHNCINLFDSRETPRYRGEQEPIDPIAGHIPGAHNKPWQEVTDAGGFIQPQIFHQQRWAELDNSTKTTVIYCGSGVTACVNILSATLAGHQATLYPGSWSDWCKREDAQMATILND